MTFAAAAGYTGMMIAWGCTVWGSGWYYPPYYGLRRLLSLLLRRTSRPTATRPGTTRGRAPTAGAPASTARTAAPASARATTRAPGTYARGAAAYGPYGARGVAQAYNPRTGTYAPTRQGSNVYGSWGSTSVQRGDDWAKTNRYTNRRTGNTTRTMRTDEGGAVTRRGDNGGAVGGRQRGNVYAGKDGNVYRKRGRHLAEVRQRRLVQHRPAAERRRPADRPPHRRPAAAPTDRGTMDQLNRDSAARRRGGAADEGLQQLPRAAAGRAALAAIGAAAAAAASRGGGRARSRGGGGGAGEGGRG